MLLLKQKLALGSNTKRLVVNMNRPKMMIWCCFAGRPITRESLTAMMSHEIKVEMQIECDYVTVLANSLSIVLRLPRFLFCLSGVIHSCLCSICLLPSVFSGTGGGVAFICSLRGILAKPSTYIIVGYIIDPLNLGDGKIVNGFIKHIAGNSMQTFKRASERLHA